MPSDHLCGVCEKPIQRTNNRGPWPKVHPQCKAKAHPSDKPARPEAKEAGPEPRTAIDVVEEFDLDFNLGNAVLWILDADRDDPLTDLRNARDYLDRAIARRER